MAAATRIPLSRLLPLAPSPRPNHSILTLRLPSAALQSNNLRWKFTTLPQKCRPDRSPVRAATGAVTPSQVPLENAQKVASAASDDGIVSTIVSVLLSVAFIGLCILTIGVIYLGVEDFLQKRNREKFEKEEAEKKKKEKRSGKKKTRVLRGPRSYILRGLDDSDD